MIASVVAVDNNFGIGSNNELLAHIPEDLKMFKEITSGGAVIVGRKTYDSLPKKPLPNRTNIIITSQAKDKPELKKANEIISNMEYIKAWLSNDEVIHDNEGIYVIGGGMIYEELLPYCERVYITKIHNAYDNADTFFPNIDDLPEWEMTSASEIKEHEGIQYQFCVYDRNDYEICDVQTHDNNKDIEGNDIVITVKTFNSYKIIIVKYERNNFNVYADNWDYLNTNGNMAKFIDKVMKYQEYQKIITQRGVVQ